MSCHLSYLACNIDVPLSWLYTADDRFTGFCHGRICGACCYEDDGDEDGRCRLTIDSPQNLSDVNREMNEAEHNTHYDKVNVYHDIYS